MPENEWQPAVIIGERPCLNGHDIGLAPSADTTYPPISPVENSLNPYINC